MDQVDYIIVGAGSAGCVLADRLSADGRHKVLVVEAGGSDRRLWVKLPIGYGKSFYDPAVNWKYQAEPDPGIDNRPSYWPRGKVVGGSSSINALVYCRGLPQDFDDWRDAGNPGWGWDDVRPVFEQIERKVRADGTATGQGPLTVTDVSTQMHPVNRHFFDAAEGMGLPRTQDLNGAMPEGVGNYPITTRGGLRCSAADAFLRPALRRPNVRLVTRALVHRITFDGPRASGIEYSQNGATHAAKARIAVILSAGAVESPKLLQLSGIGPGDLLAEMGIAVRQHNPHVGGKLQDHLAINYLYRATEPTMNNVLTPFLGKVRAAITYALTRKGPLSLSVNQAGGFVRSGPEVARPDLQLYFNPMTYTTAPHGTRPLIKPDPFPGFLICYQPCRPHSRGRIDIAAPDATRAPQIKPNYLSANRDIEDVIAGGRFLKRMAQSPSIQGLIQSPLGPDIAALDDEAMVADFRARSGTVFHPVGTCAMGSDPTDSVVDSGGRVHGVPGLRVIDASVMPNITSGNTNAPTIMLAMKAAEAVLADARN